ncbi:hypothetical protein VC83_02381 [Pseudogymnoascus destructans]|uniref:Uncharacterized protein n=1 Tax=Pseudogymnoascus destructans TaxID=655981 RepID=A0A177AHY6_9PEZI|nr:uncharacterized protein VC83_02381 [Pseudogymnoascus destructans]OAF60863.1 hypothetical protein VC83_02381 [Pseudogymnoascus destructans]
MVNDQVIFTKGHCQHTTPTDTLKVKTTSPQAEKEIQDKEALKPALQPHYKNKNKCTVTMIGAAPFNMLRKQKGAKVFAVSFKDILAEQAKEEIKEINPKLILPNRYADHHIVLEGNSKLGHAPLYNMSYEAQLVQTELEKTVQVIEIPDIQDQEDEEFEGEQQPQNGTTIPYESEATNTSSPQEEPPTQKDHGATELQEQLQMPEMTLEHPEDTVRRHDVYLATIAIPEAKLSLHQAFLVGTEFNRQSIHRTDLPAAPKFWNQLQTHPHRIVDSKLSATNVSMTVDA